MNIFDKENEKIFENNFESMLNDLAEQFIKELIEKEKNNKYFDFYLEFDNFRQKAKQLTPDFPHKDDIIYDKTMEILRKYFEENINKKFNETFSDKPIEKKKKINEEEMNKLKKENNQINNYTNNNLIVDKDIKQIIDKQIITKISNKDN